MTKCGLFLTCMLTRVRACYTCFSFCRTKDTYRKTVLMNTRTWSDGRRKYQVSCSLGVSEQAVGEARKIKFWRRLYPFGLALQGKTSSSLIKSSFQSIRGICIGYVLSPLCRRNVFSSSTPWVAMACITYLSCLGTSKMSTKTNIMNRCRTPMIGSSCHVHLTRLSSATVRVIGQCGCLCSIPVSTHYSILILFTGYDCGVFTCMFADFLSKDCPLVFEQSHVTQCRERIAVSIMNGQAIL